MVLTALLQLFPSFFKILGLVRSVVSRPLPNFCLPAMSMLYKAICDTAVCVFTDSGAGVQGNSALYSAAVGTADTTGFSVRRHIAGKEAVRDRSGVLTADTAAVLPRLQRRLSTALFSIVPPLLTAQMPPLAVPFAKDESASLMLLIVPLFI